MKDLVRTVLGDVDPQELGVTYSHEHLIIDSPIVAAGYPHIHLPSVDEAVAEVAACREVGVGAMVDTMPAGVGGDLRRLQEISGRTGIKIVGATGLHTDRYGDLAPDVDLASAFVTDIEKGAGVVKVATGEEGLDHRSMLLFQAGAEAHHRTRAPLITHCEQGRGGIGQIRVLSSLGVAPGRVVLSHTDKIPDLAYHREMLQTGVNLAYDQGLRQAGEPDQATARLLAAMIQEGYGHQLMLGTDGARRSLWSTLGGGPGLAYLAGGFVEILESEGIGVDARQLLFVDNPARWLTFTAERLPPDLPTP